MSAFGGKLVPEVRQRFDIKPKRLAGDTAYGSGANLNWLVNEAKIAPHIPVVDKSKREDGTFSREDFSFDQEQKNYICPAGKVLTTTGKLTMGRHYTTELRRAIAAAASSRRSAVQSCRCAESSAASTRRPVTLLAR